MIKTPNLDKMYEQSGGWRIFTWTPPAPDARGADHRSLSARVGVWHTIMGARSPRRRSHNGDVFKRPATEPACSANGTWATNYPYRPRDRGFRQVLCHGGGGVGQGRTTGQRLLRDTYFHNGKPEKRPGHCTDVWFDAAIEFIRSSQDAPSSATWPPTRHTGRTWSPPSTPSLQGPGVPSPMAEFYGMISNIDENIARLTRTLADLKRADNTRFYLHDRQWHAAGVAGGKSSPRLERIQRRDARPERLPV